METQAPPVQRDGTTGSSRTMSTKEKEKEGEEEGEGGEDGDYEKTL